MRCVLLTTCLAGLVAVSLSSPAKYTTKYDNLDIEKIIKSDRLLNNYFNCLMDKGPCTAEGAELKRSIPDALKTGCSKCSETQKKKSETAYNYLIKNKPQLYAQLEKKYDPDGTYKAKYEASRKKAGKS